MAVVVPEGLNELLNSYYREKVMVTKKEKDANFAYVDAAVQHIMFYINVVDNRFSEIASMYGSFCQQLVNGRADEFRYAVKLQVPDPATWVPNPDAPDQRGNYKVRTYSFDKAPHEGLDVFGRPLANGAPMTRIPKSLGIDEEGGTLPVPGYGFGYLEAGEDDDDWSDLVVEGDVIPFLVKQHFQQLLNEAIGALDMRDSVTISKKVTGSFFTLTFNRGGRDLKVDLALMVETKMPIGSWVGWPRGAWPSKDKVEAVLAAGINLRATGNFYWRESYAEAKTALIKDIDKDGGQRKKVFCILKQLNTDVFSNHSCNKPRTISSAELKNVWLWALEYNPESDAWQKDMVAARVTEIIYMLLYAIESSNMTHYFDTRKNMFKDKDPKSLARTNNRIERYMADMSKGLRPKNNIYN